MGLLGAIVSDIISGDGSGFGDSLAYQAELEKKAKEKERKNIDEISDDELRERMR